MGLYYGDFKWAGLGREGWAGKAGLGRAVLGWPGLAWDVMGFQSTVENPHKISP